MRVIISLIVSLVAIVFVPSRAEAQVNQCATSCCYCDLTVGQCKDISEFPVSGGTGYTNCYVNGMSCYYWGSSCSDEFAFEEVGPDGMLKGPSSVVAASDEFEPVVSWGLRHEAWNESDVAFSVDRDCRGYVSGIRFEPTADFAMLRTSHASER